MKSVILFLLLATLTIQHHSSHNGHNQDIIQQALNGLYEQSSLPDPVTIVKCIGDSDASKIVTEVPIALQECSKITAVTGFKKLAEDLQKWAQTLSPQLAQCLDGNPELLALCTHYDCKNLPKAKIISYLTFHAKKVAGECGAMNTQWQQGQYKQVGVSMAKMIQEILSKLDDFNGRDQDTIQQALNGLYEQSSLPDPVTIVKCIGDSDASKMVTEVPIALQECSKITAVTGFKKLAEDLQKWAQTLSPQLAQCLDGNPELLALCTHYDCKNLPKAKIISYLTFHAKKVAGECGAMNTQWAQQQYKQVGVSMAKMIQEILSKSLLEDEHVHEIQE